MDQELAMILVNDFPLIFKGRNFGFECGSGWFHIIHDLCSDLMNIAENQGSELPAATQVKEKFGSLRFYVDGFNEEYQARIQVAEELSVITCEVCGRKGKRRSGGWVQTLCDKHAKNELK